MMTEINKMKKISEKKNKAVGFTNALFDIVNKYFPYTVESESDIEKAKAYCVKYPLSDITKILDRQKADMESIKEMQYKATNLLNELEKKIVPTEEYKGIPKFRSIVKQFMTMAKNIIKYTKSVRNVIENGTDILSVQDNLTDILPEAEYFNETSILVRGVTISETLSGLLYAPLAWSKQKIVFNIPQDWCKYIFSSMTKDFDLSILENLPYDRFYTKVITEKADKLFYTEINRVSKAIHISGRVSIISNNTCRVSDITFIIPYNCTLNVAMSHMLYAQTGGTGKCIARAYDFINPFSTAPYVIYVPADKPDYIKCVCPDASLKQQNNEEYLENLVGVNHWKGVSQELVSIDDLFDILKTKGVQNYSDLFNNNSEPRTDTELLFYAQYALEVNNLELLQPYKQRLLDFNIDLNNSDEAIKVIEELCADDNLIREQDLGIDILLGTLIYLSSENAMKSIDLQKKATEVSESEVKTKPANKNKNKQKNTSAPVKSFDIAIKETEYFIRVNSKSQGITQSTGKGKEKAPHVRKAHPHTYWVGKKDSPDRHKVVKFLMPTVIHSDRFEDNEINTINSITVNTDKQIKEIMKK